MTETLIIDGDSQSAARPNVTDAQTWGAILAGWHGWAHTNCAVGGSTTATVLSRLAATLANAGSHYVLQIGANDAWIDPTVAYDFTSYWTAPKSSAVSLAQFQANLQSIIDQVRAAGKTITLVTPWAMWSTPLLTQFPFYVDAMKAVALTNGVPVVNAFEIAVRRWWASSAPNHVIAAPSFYSLYNTLGDGVTVDYQHESAALGHPEIANQFKKPQYANSPLYFAG